MKCFELKDHIAGAVYGFAVGDSVGATTEFMTKEQIRASRACGDDPGFVVEASGGPPGRSPEPRASRSCTAVRSYCCPERREKVA